MICQKCGSGENRVTDTRPFREFVYRRRECCNCGNRFTTSEIYVEDCGQMKTRRDRLRDSINQLKREADAVNDLLVCLTDFGVPERRNKNA